MANRPMQPAWRAASHVDAIGPADTIVRMRVTPASAASSVPARDTLRIPMWLATLVLSGLVLSACGTDDASAPGGGGTSGGDRPVTVTVALVREQPWADHIEALGTVRARESITVTAKVSETVQQVHFDSGDQVRAGAPLVTLGGKQQAAQLQAAQAAADEAEQLYERQEELAARQLVARSALDAQRATRDATRAQVAQVRADLGDRVIRAPFTGVLGLRQVSPGSLVTPGTAIATLDDISSVHVDFPVPEAQLASLGVGQAVGATSAAYPGRRFSGSVSTVETRIDPATRAVVVRADFPNPQRVLRPGMLLQVQLQRGERQALVVPEIAVVQIGSDSFVYRVKADDSVEQAKVEIGARDAGEVEIVDGLSVGDRIVVDGTGKLRPGAKIIQAPAAQKAGDPTPPRERGRADSTG